MDKLQDKLLEYIEKKFDGQLSVYLCHVTNFKHYYTTFNSQYIKKIHLLYETKAHHNIFDKKLPHIHFLMDYQNSILLLSMAFQYPFNTAYALKASTVKEIYEGLKNDNKRIERAIDLKDAFNQKELLFVLEKYMLDISINEKNSISAKKNKL
jgi:hypothetical protein